MKKVFFLCCLFVSLNGYTQQWWKGYDAPHTISGYFLPGYSLLQYKSSDISSIGGLELGGGIDYTYWFNRNIGLALGLQFQSYYSTFLFDNTNFTSDVKVEPGGEKYIIKQILNQEEYHISRYFQIPLRLTFKHELNKSWDIIYGIGIGYGLKAAEKHEVSKGTYSRVADFYELNRVIDSLPSQGFGTFTTLPFSDNTKQFKNMFFASADIGVQVKLNEQWKVLAGFVFNYGLNNIKTQKESIISDNPYKGVITTDYIGSIHPLAITAKIGVTFSFGERGSGVRQVKGVKVKQNQYNDDWDVMEEKIRQEKIKQEEQKKQLEKLRLEEEKRVVEQKRQQEIADSITRIEKIREQVKTISKEPILFYPGTNKIRPESIERITRIANLIQEYKVTVRLSGYAYETGNKQKDLEMSKKRVLAVKQMLLRKGTSGQYIKMSARGNNSPKVKNTTPENKRKNARVESSFIIK